MLKLNIDGCLYTSDQLDAMKERGESPYGWDMTIHDGVMEARRYRLDGKIDKSVTDLRTGNKIEWQEPEPKCETHIVEYY
jgi:hypothetical protein